MAAETCDRRVANVVAAAAISDEAQWRPFPFVRDHMPTFERSIAAAWARRSAHEQTSRRGAAQVK
jgi:hypothetical protein